MLNARTLWQRLNTNNKKEKIMKIKTLRMLLSLTIMSMIVVLNSPGQTLKPGRPPMQPIQPAPSQPAPPQPMPVIPAPVIPNPAPTVPFQPGQPVQPAQPGQPFHPAQPGQLVPNQPPVFTNQPPVFTNRPFASTKHMA